MDYISGTNGFFYRSISLSDEVISFFREKGHFLSKKTLNRMTYHDFIGKDAVPSLEEAQKTMQENEFLPFQNASQSERSRIRQDITTLITELYSEDEALRSFQRTYAIGTSTLPIQIQYTVDESEEWFSFYIKRPDANRIIGKFLYNLITGKDYPFWFTSDIFIEDDIPGTTLSYYDEESLVEKKAYLHELIRSSLHAELLGLGPDTAQPRNRLVTTDYSVVLFDFNIMFEPQQRPFQLLDRYDLSMLSSKEIKTIYQQELDSIYGRIEDQKETFETFCDVTAGLTDHMYMSITKRIRRYYESSNLKDHLLSHLIYCKGCIDHFYD